MKTPIHIGNKTIVLLSKDDDESIDMDQITSIDHSNLYGEIVTCSALLNKIGTIKADAQAIYEETKLMNNIYESNLKKKFRKDAIRKSGKVTLEDGTEIKLTENSLEELVYLDKGYQEKQKELINAKRDLEYVDSLYWGIQSKDKKLNNLLPKVTPEEFLNELVEGKVNTFIIKKIKE